MSEFFAMGGYAAFVWPSYAIGFVLLIAHVVVPLLRRRRVLKDIERRVRREARAAEQAATSKIAEGSDA